MAIKLLVLDTCAIVKYFVPEPGTSTVRWMVRNRAELALKFYVSLVARIEFASVLWKKAAHGQLTVPRTRGILQRSRGYFRDVFHVRDTDPVPVFRTGDPLEYKALVKKYGLNPGRNDLDVWHLMCAHNYLRCFGGVSRPIIVTSDPDVKKMTTNEGYSVLDPVLTTPEKLKTQWE